MNAFFRSVGVEERNHGDVVPVHMHAQIFGIVGLVKSFVIEGMGANRFVEWKLNLVAATNANIVVKGLDLDERALVTGPIQVGGWVSSQASRARLNTHTIRDAGRRFPQPRQGDQSQQQTEGRERFARRP